MPSPGLVLPAQEGGLWAICLELVRETDWYYLRGGHIYSRQSVPILHCSFPGEPHNHYITTSSTAQFPFGGNLEPWVPLESDRRWRGGVLYVVTLGASLVALL